MTRGIFYYMPIFEMQDKNINLISPRLNIFVFEMFGSKYTKMLTGLINSQYVLWMTSWFSL